VINASKGFIGYKTLLKKKETSLNSMIESIVAESIQSKPPTLEEQQESTATLSSLPNKPVVANRADASFGGLDLHELWMHRELLYFLIWRDIKVRYKQTAVGAAWAIIQPLLMMLIFALFFGRFIRVPSEGFPYLVFFYCGLLPWTFFSNAVSVGSMSLVNSSHIINKVYFPRVLIPAAAVGAGLVDLLIASTILFGLSIYYDMAVTRSILMLPILIVLTVFLALAIGMWLAALTVKYRDVRHALPFVLQVWFFLTPIIYPIIAVPAKWRWMMSVNPFTGIVEGIRSSLVGRGFNWRSLAMSVAMTLAISVCSIYAFRRIERSIADLV
jgi:lipopolysaccharide transport system permease protein